MKLNQWIQVMLWIFVLLLIPACRGGSTIENGEFIPTMTPITILEQGITPMPLCTPPACEPDEVYHCPDDCPGGCGTTCATITPGPEVKEVVESDLVIEGPPSVPEGPPSVAAFPDPTLYAWVSVAQGLDKPLGLTHAGDHTSRTFVLEQPGLIWMFQDWERNPTPFLDIRDRVVDSQNEQGLLGLAFHPNFKENGLFYINYTGENGDTFISRFNMSSDPNVADASSKKMLLRIDQPYGNHNGGHLLFGPEGYLYIGTGDGGSGGDPQGNAQNRDSLLGKMLRIDVDQGDPYGVPADNPYSNGGGRPEIWAIGLRNPWRFSFDRTVGDLYIGDVGQNQWEEISFLPAGQPGGANFGWDYWEANHPFEGSPPDDVEMISPIWEYDHANGCSVTGGVTYRGSLPDWQGIYLYGDFCSGTIWGLLRDAGGSWQNMALYQTRANITAFGEDESGEIYMIDRRGSINMLVKKP
jgi:glucose/arabinose dehydrogenase